MVEYHISPEIIINETDILENEAFLIEGDIYSQAISALMTKECTPEQEGIAIKMSMMVFFMQNTLLITMMDEYLDLNNFQRFDIDTTIARVISGVLLHNVSFQKFQYM